MTRLLLEQGLAPHAAAILRGIGMDVVHVSEIGMEQAEDIQILEKARNDTGYASLWTMIFTLILLSPAGGARR